MKISKLFLTASLALMGLVNGAQAAALTVCPGTPGLRELTFESFTSCTSGLGNFTPAEGATTILNDFGGVATHLDKDQASGDIWTTHETWLTGFGAGGTSGTWTIAQAAWDANTRLFVGFHFGQGKGDPADNPDWFIVEVENGLLGGNWALGGAGAQLMGLSHIDLFGVAGPDGGTIPEPGSLALVAAGLLGLAGFARKRKQA